MYVFVHCVDLEFQMSYAKLYQIAEKTFLHRQLTDYFTVFVSQVLFSIIYFIPKGERVCVCGA